MTAKNLEFESGGLQGGNWDGVSPEVLDIIFHYLPVADLLSCSLVCKKWKKLARDVLKRSRECYVKIKDFRQDIQDLNGMIASTDVMEVINGLHIRSEMAPHSTLLCQMGLVSRCFEENSQWIMAMQNLEASKRAVQEVLGGQWKYLNFDTERLSIADTLLLEEIILASSDSLQKLVIGKEKDWSLMPLRGIQFGKLKVIHIQSQRSNFCSEATLSKFAPNLEKITGAMMDLRVHAPGRGFMLKRMKSIRLRAEWQVPGIESTKILESFSGLQGLDLQHYHLPKRDNQQVQDLSQWNNFVFLIVRSNSDTLLELRMFTMELYKLLSTSDDLKFPDLRRLSLSTHSNIALEQEILALKQMRLAKRFPNLEHVELLKAKCTHELEHAVNLTQVSEELAQSDIPVGITLDFSGRPCSYEYLEFLKTVYPKINTVKILVSNQVSNACELSRMFWDLTALEHLEFCFSQDLHYLDSMDAILCGINVEETGLLFSGFQSKEAVIVPIRPSLFNAKNLKELKITQQVVNRRGFRRSWVVEVIENLPARHVRYFKVKFEGSDALYCGLHDLRAFTALGANEIDT